MDINKELKKYEKQGFNEYQLDQIERGLKKRNRYIVLRKIRIS